jgi:hypothetical protein
MGEFMNPEVKAFDTIANVSFLGLVGEPGMGKSSTLQLEYQRLRPIIDKNGGEARLVTLDDITSPSELDKAIFEAPWLASWKTGSKVLHLFVDGLDEAERFFPVANALVKRLEGLPLERLYLRLACRTSSWPELMDAKLPVLWKAAGAAFPYDVYELTPLRRQDVELAASEAGLDATAFTTSLIEHHAVPWATRPLTLEFLLNSTKADRFPSTLSDLYAVGCSYLIREENLTRRAAGSVGALDEAQRLRIAKRIAAVTVLANRQGIWTGREADCPEGYVSLGQLSGVEDLDGRHLDVSETALREVLGTGLFSSRGSLRQGWAHQAFAEYLAAQYLLQSNVSGPQLISLITVPDDPAGGVRPQLVATVGWLATGSAAIAIEILRRDPAVLLESDLPALDETVRRTLVSQILNLYDNAQLLDHEGVLNRHYGGLRHGSLAQQLAKYIESPEYEVHTRREAIRMARACGVTDLAHLLATVALDPANALSLRESAAHSVGAMGVAAAMRRLGTLAKGVPEDEDDELKGASLDALWPADLTSAELFSCLTLPRRINHVGSYRMFLGYSLADALRAEDLPNALRWLSTFDENHRDSMPFERLATAILSRVWKEGDLRPLLVDLTKAICTLAGLHFNFQNVDFRSPEDRRRALLLELVRSLAASPGRWPRLGIPTSDDFGWLLSNAEADSGAGESLWLRLASDVYLPDDLRHANALVDAAARSPVVREAFAFWLGDVALKSKEAQSGRRGWRRMRAREALRQAERSVLEENLQQNLQASERGRPEAWFNLGTILQKLANRSPDQKKSESKSQPPGWASVEDSVQRRLVTAAQTYLDGWTPGTEWVVTNEIPYEISAGMDALRLCASETPSYLRDRPSSFWTRWAPTVFAYPFQDSPSTEYAVLRELAFRAAPDVVIATVNRLITSENDRNGWTSVPGRLGSILNGRLIAALQARVKDGSLRGRACEAILECLVSQGDSASVELARETASKIATAEGEDRERALAAAEVLWRHRPLLAWDTTWGIFDSDSDAAKELVVRLARTASSGRATFLGALPEHNLAQLFGWIISRYPLEFDKPVFGVVSDTDSVRMMRDAVLSYLVGRGTPASEEAVQELREKHPSLRWAALLATNNRRRNTGRWPAARHVLDLTVDKSRRLVADASQLRSLLLEALDRFQAILGAETPAIRDLWDWDKDHDLYQPKPEVELSNYLKRFLDADIKGRGVVVNREVQINRGDKTDIHVTAVTPGHTQPYDQVTVVIEVKGSWNQGLNTDVETQLAARYLGEHKSHHGIYAVFWFASPKWDPADWRRDATRRNGDRAALRGELGESCERLSANGLVIELVVVDATLPG